MVGAPVIIKHQDVTDENADELRCGVISKAYFNELDGWYYAEGIIWDTKAQELINNKDWSVSCSYDFLSYNDEGGVENNIKYDKEFTSLNFTHLALVNNPRYERANIVFNSKLIDNARGFDGSEGQWVTIKGTHVFIPDGKTLDDVLEAKGWSKQSDTKDDGNKAKIYTEDTYDEFHKKFYKEHDDKWTFQRTTKGYDVHRTNKNKKWEFDQDLNKENLDKYLTDKVVKLRLPNIPKKDKNGDTEFQEDTKNLQLFKDKGYEPSDKYDDGYYTNYILKKSDTSDTKEPETITEKIKSFEDKIPKNYRRDEQTKALWLYKNNYITRSEWEKFRIDNSKEKEMSLIDEIKKLIRKVENNKETEEMIENEKTDKRKLIDEVAGIMKSAGCDDEDIRTAIGKMEKIGYDASEDSKADNKKVKNEDEEDKKEDKKEDKEVDNEDAEDKKEAEDLKEDAKEDVKNKCKNDKSSFDKINEIYNSVKTLKVKTEYETRDEKLKNAEEYFG